MDSLFRIGDFCFRILSELPYPVPEHFRQFGIETGIPEYTYRLREVRSLPELDGKRVALRPDMEVIQEGQREYRLIGRKGDPAFYGCYREVSSQEAEIWVTKQIREQMPSDPLFCSLLALDRRMIDHGSLILHCAYTEHRGGAILFSAPSGTGKSTQADLWERYRNSRTINGDRALLRKSQGVWWAGGWPVCGSSGICTVADTPIRAIVMLRQAPDNHAVRLSPIQAFTRLYGQVTINQWNRGFVQRAMELLEELIRQVPVYQLSCNITEEAVNCLENALFP